jgi:hypothetical protein
MNFVSDEEQTRLIVSVVMGGCLCIGIPITLFFQVKQ